MPALVGLTCSSCVARAHTYIQIISVVHHQIGFVFLVRVCLSLCLFICLSACLRSRETREQSVGLFRAPLPPFPL